MYDMHCNCKEKTTLDSYITVITVILLDKYDIISYLTFVFQWLSNKTSIYMCLV